MEHLENMGELIGKYQVAPGMNVSVFGFHLSSIYHYRFEQKGDGVWLAKFQPHRMGLADMQGYVYAIPDGDGLILRFFDLADKPPVRKEITTWTIGDATHVKARPVSTAAMMMQTVVDSLNKFSEEATALPLDD